MHQVHRLPAGRHIIIIIVCIMLHGIADITVPAARPRAPGSPHLCVRVRVRARARA